MKNENVFKPISGWMPLVLVILLPITFYLFRHPVWWIVGGLIFLLLASGFIIINPNSSRVLILFGKYVGTIKEDGFFWANPFFIKKAVSLRANNFDSERLKVNDKRGNPIQISVILVWRVKETFKAVFEVEDLFNFVKIQTDSAVRKLAGQYAYDHVDDHQEVTLRASSDEVNQALENELQERLVIAGIEVMEARIAYLAYAPEIAAAMLKRQQAEAIVSARYKIVEGAVGMVENAMEQIKTRQIAEFDDKEKARMVGNLMVVLCSDKETSPVIEMNG
ncbi:MAG: SPFH domain-containing protein [Saprospiraceae bacterium]|nr:SPFH domain-containing protein [Saprospiraceae bacterium]MBK7809752.1 SPFH domain-containing protein [Saprospiraceae bacterium]MBK9632137.1 SPFH domain-containing protein [Saprospiraceae bacterium]